MMSAWHLPLFLRVLFKPAAVPLMLALGFVVGGAFLVSVTVPTVNSSEGAPQVTPFLLWQAAVATMAAAAAAPVQPVLRWTSQRLLFAVDLFRLLLIVAVVALATWGMATLIGYPSGRLLRVTLGLLAIALIGRRVVGAMLGTVVVWLWVGLEYAFGLARIVSEPSPGDPWAGQEWRWQPWSWVLSPYPDGRVVPVLVVVALVVCLLASRRRWAHRG